MPALLDFMLAAPSEPAVVVRPREEEDFARCRDGARVGASTSGIRRHVPVEDTAIVAPDVFL